MLEAGKITKTGVYLNQLPVVILPNKSDAFVNETDTKQTAVLQSEVDKQYARLNFALQQQRCKMLQFILTHISDESKSKLEREEIMKHIMQRLTLWQCGNCCSSCIALDTAASRRKDRNLLPMPGIFLKMVMCQAFVNFRRDYTFARKVKVDCGNADRTEKEAAWNFIDRLDTTQFGGFQQFY